MSQLTQLTSGSPPFLREHEVISKNLISSLLHNKEILHFDVKVLLKFQLKKFEREWLNKKIGTIK